MINFTSQFLSLNEKDNQAHININYGFENYIFSKQFIDDFKHILIYVEDNNKIDTVVINAPPTRLNPNFDLKTALKKIDIHFFVAWEKVVTALERLPKCTIAKLSGDISSPFLQLAIVCDYKIALYNSTFCFPEINYGILPGMAIFRIAKYIGLGCAKKLILSGERLNVENALSMHLIDQIVASNEELNEFEYHLTAGKTLTSIIMARRLLNECFHDSYEDAIGHYLAAQSRCLNVLNRSTTQTTHQDKIVQVEG